MYCVNNARFRGVEISLRKLAIINVLALLYMYKH
jgi:hypothetical protein